jgi:hypothetical protein
MSTKQKQTHLTVQVAKEKSLRTVCHLGELDNTEKLDATIVPTPSLLPAQQRYGTESFFGVFVFCVAHFTAPTTSQIQTCFVRVFTRV